MLDNEYFKHVKTFRNEFLSLKNPCLTNLSIRRIPIKFVKYININLQNGKDKSEINS